MRSTSMYCMVVEDEVKITQVAEVATALDHPAHAWSCAEVRRLAHEHVGRRLAEANGALVQGDRGETFEKWF